MKKGRATMEKESSQKTGTSYPLQELLPLVARLAEKYTGFDSSSVTYERAQMLMEAVIYCIREYEYFAGSGTGSGEGNLWSNVQEREDPYAAKPEKEQIAVDSAISGNEAAAVAKQEKNAPQVHSAKMPANKTAANKTERVEKLLAKDAYKRGYELVIQKAKAANELYGRIMEDFRDYGNRALYDTMVREMPGFFLRYDARFAPQEELLLLDYPVMRPLGELRGIDRVYQYLCSIREEQEYLRTFPEGHVRETCAAYNEDYGELFISLSEIMAAGN